VAVEAPRTRGFIKDQHRVRFGQRLQRIVPHHIAQGVGLPVTAPQHRLLAPRTTITDRLGAHPAGLAPFRPEQRVQEGGGRCRDARMGEQGAELVLGAPQFG
jgi:hypothetical protein